VGAEMQFYQAESRNQSVAVTRLIAAVMKVLQEDITETSRELLLEGIKGIRFDTKDGPDYAAWGEDAVQRGSNGEPITQDDWRVLKVCVQGQKRIQVMELADSK